MVQKGAPRAPRDGAIVIPDGKHWFDLAPASAGLGTPSDPKGLLRRAEHAYLAEAERFKRSGAVPRSDSDFLETMLRSGTAKDRISALTVAVHSFAFHRLVHLQKLVELCAAGRREDQLLAAESVKDLLINCVLPDRKLLFAAQQRVGDAPSAQQLALAYFEDSVKRAVFEYVAVLEKMLKDSVEHVRSRALGFVFELLCAKPEQEANLLALLANKLGDQSKRVASKTGFLLSKLLVAHPAMGVIVAQAVRDVVLRQPSAAYYAVVFLIQIVQSPAQGELASKLVEIYLQLFQKHVSEAQSEDSRMAAALLTGLHRALPFAHKNAEQTASLSEPLFRLAHSHNFSVGLQSLNVLERLSRDKPELHSRFMRTLYAIIGEGRMATSKRQAAFMTLLQKALKRDQSVPRVKAFVKRLLQASLQAPVALVCAILLLTSKLATDRPQIGELLLVKSGADDKFDAKKRSPEYANAESATLFELAVLARHFHPTVRKYAADLLRGELIECERDPFDVYSVSHFLDNYVFRPAKRIKQAHNADEVVDSDDEFDQLLGRSADTGGEEYSDDAMEESDMDVLGDEPDGSDANLDVSDNELGESDASPGVSDDELEGSDADSHDVPCVESNEEVSRHVSEETDEDTQSDRSEPRKAGKKSKRNKKAWVEHAKRLGISTRGVFTDAADLDGII